MKRKVLGTLLAGLAVAVLGACSNSTNGSFTGPGGSRSSGSAEGGSGSSTPTAPPDLATFPGGKVRLSPLSQHGPIPDACKILTPAMMLALIPAGAGATVSTPRSSTQGHSTPVVCQYRVAAKDGSGKGGLIIDFSQVGLVSASVNHSVYAQDVAAARSMAHFRSFGGTLGAGSMAFYNPNSIDVEVLYKGQSFSVSAEGLTIGDDQPELSFNVAVPVVRNIVARMNGA